MIAFAASITDPPMYDRACGRGVELAKEPDSVVLARAAAGSIYKSYNLILDQAAEIEGLEALALLHQDAEIRDADFCRKVRDAMADPDVGLVGCVGAVGVRSIAWWDGQVTWASFTHKYEEFGGGEVPAFGWEGQERPPYAQVGTEVETLDGFVLVLSPWVVKNCRFDETLGALHGYDLDYCLTVREQGKKIVTADFQVVHHHSLDLVSNHDTWVEAHMRIAEKWAGRMPNVGDGPDDWKARARRAEAEAAVWRTMARAEELKRHAAVKELSESLSWKVTRPLRALNRVRKALPDPHA